MQYEEESSTHGPESLQERRQRFINHRTLEGKGERVGDSGKQREREWGIVGKKGRESGG